MTDDYHAASDAEVDDTRMKVRQTGLGIDIVRQRYALTKYDNDGPTRWFDWFDDETFHLRADEIGPVIHQVQDDIDVGQLLDDLHSLQDLDRELTEAFGGSE